MPQLAAAPTAARNSSSSKVETSSGLCGEATPPPAVSLTCEAPSSSCSRTRMRTSSGESAIMLPPSTSLRVSGPPITRGSSVGLRKSPCPPVMVIIAPDG